MIRGKFRIDHSKTFATLPNAPIAEAVLHWQSAALVCLSEAELTKQLVHFFPDYEVTQQHNLEAAFTTSPAGIELKQTTNWEGVRLTKYEGDKAAFVCQFKQDGVVVSRLAPYQDWSEFSLEALKFWKAFVEIGEPREIVRLSVRYISQIQIHSIAESRDFIGEIDDPLAGIGLPADSFFHQDTVNLDELPYTINLVRAVQPHSPSAKSLIVDILVSTKDGIADFSILPEKLMDLRFIKNEVFFKLMNDVENKFGGKSK